jgi:hypothetical protein
MRSPNTIPLEACKDRQLYQLRSRNLRVGVFSAEQRGFFGLRTKFGSTFIDIEYHWDADAHHGTACPLEALGVSLPEEIPLANDLGAACRTCGRAIAFNTNTKEWVHSGEGTCTETDPASVGNEAFHEWLRIVTPGKD